MSRHSPTPFGLPLRMLSGPPNLEKPAPPLQIKSSALSIVTDHPSAVAASSARQRALRLAAAV